MKRKNLNFGAVVLVTLVTLVFWGCSKDQDDELSLLGEWIEESPEENRTELYFYSSSRLTRTTNDTISVDYRYRINENAIFLRPEGETEESETELFFKQINENSFQIENLYPSTAEGEVTYMIFIRSNGAAPEDN